MISRLLRFLAIVAGMHGALAGAVRAEIPQVRLVPVSEGVLVAPVAVRNAADGSGRMFIVDQRGLIQILVDGEVLETPFLDIEERLVDQRANFDERGLLGLAFHPNYASAGQPGHGKFYVYYSAPSPNAPGTAQDPVDHRSVISEFTVSGDPDVADGNSERILLTFDQPQFNHDGGDLAFGPLDGLLYISTGDGGSSDDNNAGHTGGNSTKPSGVLGNAQDRTNLLGKILRIDPLGNNGPGGEYGIPATNPFVGAGGGVREEIHAYGLRNPWRISFDDGPGGTNRLFVADVGQRRVEEINLVEAGDNLGWRNREGGFEFDGTAPGTGPFVDPVSQYAHPGTVLGDLPEIGLSVTGGCVYRGTLFPTLQGVYFFGDWSNDFQTPGGTLLGLEESEPGEFSLGVLDVVGGNPIPRYITGFGKDESGEIYVATRTVLPPEVDSSTSLPTGGVYRIQPTATEFTIELPPDRDTTLFGENDNANGAGEWIFAGLTNNGHERRALLRFDVAGSLPLGASISHAELILTMDMTIAGPTGFQLQALTSDWGEGASDAPLEEGTGIAASPGDATWNYAMFDSVAWSAGGEFAPEVTAQTVVAGGGSYTWTSAELIREVQRWLDGEMDNHGWILRTESSSIPSAKRFRSRESPETGDRPILRVTYFVDTDPVYQPDGTIGRPGRLLIGDGIHNLSAVGQQVRLKGKGKKGTRFRFAVENDGNAIDAIRVTASRGNRFVSVMTKQLTAGNRNVTGSLAGGGLVLGGISPGESEVFESRVRGTRKAAKKRAVARRFQHRAVSNRDLDAGDRVDAKVILK